jgi:hypothetical protein
MEWYFFFNLKKSTLKATKNYIDLFLWYIHAGKMNNNKYSIVRSN